MEGRREAEPGVVPEPVIRRLAARGDVWESRPDAVIPAPPVPQPSVTPGPGASISVWNLDQIEL